MAACNFPSGFLSEFKQTALVSRDHSLTAGVTWSIDCCSVSGTACDCLLEKSNSYIVKMCSVIALLLTHMKVTYWTTDTRRFRCAGPTRYYLCLATFLNLCCVWKACTLSYCSLQTSKWGMSGGSTYNSKPAIEKVLLRLLKTASTLCLCGKLSRASV